MANALSDFLGGFQAGDEITSRQREQRQTNQLARLAPQVVTGDPQAYAQAAAINPQAAQQYQQSGDQIAVRARGAAKYLQTALQSGNQQQIMAARQTIKPFMDTLKPGSSYPLDMDPTQEAAGLQGFLVQTSYLDPEVKNGAPTGFREFQMKAAAAGLQPGTPEYQNAAKIALGQEGRASSSGFSQVKFTGPDGRERIGVMNGRTGQIDLPDGTSFNPQTGAMDATQGAAGMVLPQGGGQQVVEQDAALANQMIAAGIPSEQVDRFLQSRAAEFSGSAVQPISNAPNAFVGRAPEEQAAATAAAQRAVELGTLAPELQMRTQDAVQRVGATTAVEAGAKRQAEQMGQREERTRDARDTLSLLARAEQILPGATGSRGGQLVDAAAGLVGSSTPGAQATAQLQTIAGQLTSKMPRMQGPQSDRDVQLYQQMAGDLANANIPVETRMAALRTIRALNQKYANQPAASQTRGTAPAASTSSYSDLWK
ncbi:hypothetical protein BRN31_23145 [Xanthomonas oryzae pv. oryzae]|uniref:hypothetical protein n=1 Tax=Xanthomonas oryzae TaxID=347 RepID=UPI000DDFEA1C|nr:hypothetical protein [Xanthomonas oryzae]RBL21890.1 hypothetical protein BRN31_23145 [Xanthomonas oryzae pv. oryzae]RBL58684.1 hypothetical protein BRN24_16080 [Xanthomonas oryzae pv. oryzae]